MLLFYIILYYFLLPYFILLPYFTNLEAKSRLLPSFAKFPVWLTVSSVSQFYVISKPQMGYIGVLLKTLNTEYVLDPLYSFFETMSFKWSGQVKEA